jgi:hypothetical protein
VDFECEGARPFDSLEDEVSVMVKALASEEP